LAHGHLATTDMGLVFFFVLTLWLFRKYFLDPSWKNALWFGVSFSGAILAKFSGVLILPVLVVFMILFTPKKEILSRVGKLLVAVIVAIVISWIVYAFSMRADLASASGFGSFLWVPFKKYYDGYQMVADHNAIGHWSYYNGNVGYNGWWTYFLEVLALKLTLPVLAATAMAIVFFKKMRKKFYEEFLIIFPFIFYLAMALTSKIDIGIRHVLVILPFLFIFISRLASLKNRFILAFVAVVAILQIIIAILAFPNYISYFNQIAGGSVNGSKYIADSNIDWDQNMIRFADYAEKNNIKKVYELCWNYEAFGYYGIQADLLPTTPPDGMVVICVQQIRVPPPGFNLKWATKYPPDKIIGDTMYVWDFRNRK